VRLLYWPWVRRRADATPAVAPFGDSRACP
jgi:hypothetical protein